MLTFYHYSRCSTCVKAKKYLSSKRHSLKEIDLTLNPPSREDLTRLIKKSEKPYTAFLNRSGQRYRELNMKEKLKKLSETDVIKMLASEGRLIKRPIVTDGKKVTVGFSEEEFKRTWPKKS